MRVVEVLLVLLGSSPWALAGEVDLDALMAAEPAKRLSEYRLFEELRTQQPSVGLLPYTVATELFSDYAIKKRYVYLPFGTAASYHETEVFKFPVGTVLVKSFGYPRDLRETEEIGRLIETRLLVRLPGGWRALTYIWNSEQTDAFWSLAGALVDVAFTDSSGVRREATYVVPNQNQCKSCHSFNQTLAPIGPKARNLNREYSYSSGNENQLEYWKASGYLKGLPELTEVPPSVSWKDAEASLESRARSYLDVNCAHCHREEGAASHTGLLLTYGEEKSLSLGVRKRPVAAGRGSGELKFDIVPGKPEESILVYRMKSTKPAVMMPELGRSLVHEEGVSLIEEWISELENRSVGGLSFNGRSTRTTNGISPFEMLW